VPRARARRPGSRGVGRGGHDVARGLTRDGRARRGARAAGRRARSPAHRADLAGPAGAHVVVRRRRHRVLRAVGDRPRAVGPQGPGPRSLAARPPRRPGARHAARRRQRTRDEPVHRGAGRGDRRLGRREGAGRQDRLRQARQREPRLRPRAGRRVRRGGAGGHRPRPVADDRPRRPQPLDRRRGRGAHARLRGARPALDRGAAGRRRSGGLRDAPGQDLHVDRLRRARVERARARARHPVRDLRRRGHRPRPCRGHHRVPARRADRRGAARHDQRALVVQRDRALGQPRAVLGAAVLPAAGEQAAREPHAA
jgi:hypothetical protein